MALVVHFSLHEEHEHKKRTKKSANIIQISPVQDCSRLLQNCTKVKFSHVTQKLGQISKIRQYEN